MSKVLTRKFVWQRLSEYYQQPAHQVVGTTTADISFRSILAGGWQWRRLLKRLYNKQQGQWLTPVELFRPHYSKIMANFVAKVFHDHDAGTVNRGELEVVEIGGGQGTNANVILSHLREKHPKLYERVSFRIIDASEPLLAAQEVLFKNGPHAGKVHLELKDMLDVAEDRIPLLSPSTNPTVVIALELFDNLPHDKVRRDKRTRLMEQAMVVPKTETPQLEQILIESSSVLSLDVSPPPPPSVPEAFQEVFVPLVDPLLTKTLVTMPSLGGATGLPIWVPSVAYGVLRRLGSSRPNISLLVADFDWLPPPDISSAVIKKAALSVAGEEFRSSTWAEGEPLVTCMDGIDHECYVRAPSPCDILFPVDFIKMASFIKRTWNDDINTATAVISIQKQAEFLLAYGPDEIRATRGWFTGFTPLLHDFANCSVLTVTRKKQKSSDSKSKYEMS